MTKSLENSLIQGVCSIISWDFVILLFLDTFEYGKCLETGKRPNPLSNNHFCDRHFTIIYINHHHNHDHNEDDDQNPTYYRVGGGKKVKEESERITTANQLHNRLIMIMILSVITMMMIFMMITSLTTG